MSDDVTEEMLDVAVKAYKAPRLHLNDTTIDRQIDMRAALEAALAVAPPRCDFDCDVCREGEDDD